MARTPFNPEVHGFSFNNSWNLDIPTLEAFQKLTTAGMGIELGLLLGMRKKAKRLGLILGLTSLTEIGLLIANRRAKNFIFGLCGGISFTVLDYFLQDMPLPTGIESFHPTSHSPEGKAIRSYIWERTNDSLSANTLTFLRWMFILHFLPQGKNKLNAMTRIELEKLKIILDRGTPWPVGLVGTTWSPFINHQVLAIGYEAHNDEEVVYLYDSNCPSVTSEIRISNTVDGQAFYESCPTGKRGLLMGFFCENYTAKQPSI